MTSVSSSSANLLLTARKQQKVAAEVAMSSLRKKALQRNGKLGIKEIGRLVRLMDRDNSGHLDANELRTGIRDMMGVCIADEEFEAIQAALDPNGDGVVDVDEFVWAFRGPLPLRRKTVIDAAFKRLDRDGSGAIDIADVRDFYDVSRHPQVLSGQMSPHDAHQKFLSQFEADEYGQPKTVFDGVVTYEEFCNYYAGVSSNIDSDEHFELLLIRAWALDRPPKPRGAGVGDSQKARTITIKLDTDGARTRQNHPLYQTSMMAYGSTAENHVADKKFNRPGAFTKNAPPFSGGSGLNCGTVKGNTFK